VEWKGNERNGQKRGRQVERPGYEVFIKKSSRTLPVRIVAAVSQQLYVSRFGAIMDSVQEAERGGPPWGALPVEKYLMVRK